MSNYPYYGHKPSNAMTTKEWNECIRQQRQARLSYVQEHPEVLAPLADFDSLLVEPDYQSAADRGYIGAGNCVKISGEKLGNGSLCGISWEGERPTEATTFTFSNICRHIALTYQKWLTETALSVANQLRSDLATGDLHMGD